VKAQDQYHVGIVVDDLDATLQRLTDTAGYRWCDQYAGDQEVTTPDGEITIPLRFAYSVDEPRLEIIEAVPGTLWVPADSGLHHLGYWSDDVAGDTAALVERGYRVDAEAMLDDLALWTYCSAPGGPRIELVNRIIEPFLRDWFTTGRLPEGDMDLLRS
jgi:hypothetical protein